MDETEEWQLLQDQKEQDQKEQDQKEQDDKDAKDNENAQAGTMEREQQQAVSDLFLTDSVPLAVEPTLDPPPSSRKRKLSRSSTSNPNLNALEALTLQRKLRDEHNEIKKADEHHIKQRQEADEWNQSHAKTPVTENFYFYVILATGVLLVFLYLM